MNDVMVEMLMVVYGVSYMWCVFYIFLLDRFLCLLDFDGIIEIVEIFE